MAESAIQRWNVSLRGLAPIMFDRYAGDNKTQLREDQKLYLDGDIVVLPALNIMSFLSAENTVSAPKRLYDSRKFKEVCRACLSFVTISPELIPLTRQGKAIQFCGFDDHGQDESGGLYIHHSVARLEKGIPNPKSRPVVRLPWEMTFQVALFPNGEIQPEQLQNLFVKGGVTIGFGTFRGVFGKFEVVRWDRID